MGHQQLQTSLQLLTAEELAQDPDDVFTLLGRLGEGSYGSVHKAVHKRSGTFVAIKKIPVENDLDESLKEIAAMNGCESPFVIAFYGSYIKENLLWIIMEYCAAGSVTDIMNLCHTTLKEQQIAIVCKYVLQGLSYLHSKRKIHRDIKAGNILINTQGEAKLADFGVAGQLSDSMSKRTTVIGTPFWMAPEVIQEVGYGVSADIWSLGITCIEMADGRPPYHNIHPMRAIFMIPTKPPPTLEHEERYSRGFRDFVARCLTKDPKRRPTADTLLQDPFITSAPGLNVLAGLVSATLDAIARGGLETTSNNPESDPDDSNTDEDEDSGSDSRDEEAARLLRSGGVKVSIQRSNSANRKTVLETSAFDDLDKTIKVRPSQNNPSRNAIDSPTSMSSHDNNQKGLASVGSSLSPTSPPPTSPYGRDREKDRDSDRDRSRNRDYYSDRERERDRDRDRSRDWERDRDRDDLYDYDEEGAGTMKALNYGGRAVAAKAVSGDEGAGRYKMSRVSERRDSSLDRREEYGNSKGRGEYKSHTNSDYYSSDRHVQPLKSSAAPGVGSPAAVAAAEAAIAAAKKNLSSSSSTQLANVRTQAKSPTPPSTMSPIISSQYSSNASSMLPTLPTASAASAALAPLPTSPLSPRRPTSPTPTTTTTAGSTTAAPPSSLLSSSASTAATPPALRRNLTTSSVPMVQKIEDLKDVIRSLEARMDRELNDVRSKYEIKKGPIVEAILAKGGTLPSTTTSSVGRSY